MAGIPMTVTAIPAYPTQVPFNSSFPSLPPIANSSWAHRFGTPDDLVVISARRINSILPPLITASMALGLVVSDWSIHLPWEWKLLTRRKKWKLSHIAYFASRIGGLGYTICALLHSVVGNVAGGPMELGAARWDYANLACQADRRASTFFSVVSIAGSSGILLLRCLALYRFHIVAVISLGLLWLATPAFLIVNIFVLGSQSKRNGISACDPTPPKRLANPIMYMMPWFVLPIFDSTILVLSLIGLRRASHRRRSSPLEKMFRKDNIFYYAIVFLCVIPIPIWYLCQQRDGRMMPYLNLYIGLSSILSCRMFINLWKAIGRELALAHTFGSNTQDHYRMDTSMEQATAGLVGSRASLPTSEGQRDGSGSILEPASSTDDSIIGASPLGEKATSPPTSVDVKTPSATTRDSDAISTTQSLYTTRLRRIVPDWTDVDPDLAYSLNGDYYGDTNSISYDYQSRGMHSTPY